MTLQERHAGTPTQRFLSKFTQGSPTECWLWEKATDANGYGVLRVGEKTVKAHRFSYEHFVGPIPKGKELDHQCRTPPCVNPDHLLATTHKENLENCVASNGKSGVRGVTWDGTTGKWRGEVAHHGVKHRTGRFSTIEEAAEAVSTLRATLHTNLPL